MKFTRLLTLPLTALIALCATPPAAAAPPGATAADGYVRLAHFSPDTPAVDVYLYDFGGEKARLVLKHVPYGALSPYQKLAPGQYTVAMRAAGAESSAPPVLSTNVRVVTGRAYTVAGTGPFKSIRLSVLPDTADVPSQRAGLRFVAASLKTRSLRLGVGDGTVASRLRFGAASGHLVLPPGERTVTARGASGESATSKLSLAPGAVHTVVVLDGEAGLTLLDVRDAAGPGITPEGGVDTGLGGLATTAPAGASNIGTAPAGAPNADTANTGTGSPGTILAVAVLAALIAGTAVTVRRRTPAPSVPPALSGGDRPVERSRYGSR
ncbi:DUF4397 domain-containing protein [Streptosporangium sp. V21-05]|uniref:DUF4397 domain-containing protein n=1 Tax=Streptosporangium sp. V21-05 TaxID=3446115 RepID=UPI003F529D81